MQISKEWRTRDTYGDHIAVFGNKLTNTVMVSFTDETDTATMLFGSRFDIDKFIEKLMKARKYTYGN